MALLLAAMMAVPLSSCKDETSAGPAHDPNKPIVCESFYPKGGPISTQVVLTGQNFGSKVDEVQVFFNDKEAPVVGVSGDHMLVLAPRLPGENVVIKVVIGNQASTFNDFFDYEIQTNISTVCGGDASAQTNPDGTISLSEAQFKSEFEWGIQVDGNGNIFFGFNADADGSTHNYRYVANIAADKLKRLEEAGTFLTFSQFAYDPIDDRVYHIQSNIGNNEYWWHDVNNDFVAMDKGEIGWKDHDTDFVPDGLAVFAARKAAAMRKSDHMFYTRSYGGYMERFDPATGIGENLTKLLGGVGIGSTKGSTLGMAWDKTNDNYLYFSNDEMHCIYRTDFSTGRTSVAAGQAGQAGYLDGPLTTALFNKPMQMAVDSEGNIYVADAGNHCIRKINLETAYVSTVAGIPQSSGYVNGTSEFAKFNEPTGLCIDKDDIIYVSDRKNHAIRRVAIE